MIDFGTRTSALAQRLRVAGFGPQHLAMIEEALRDVALAAGDAVQREYLEDQADCRTCEGGGDEPNAAEADTPCPDCDGSGHIDAAEMLGIKRPR